MKNRSFKAFAGGLFILIALMPVSAMAAQFRSERSQPLTVSQMVNDDLYAAGSGVDVAAPVAGDAVLAGGNITVSGTVGQSILAAGGTVTIAGNVGRNVRVLGGNVFVNGSVMHDVIVLGGQINISSTALIGGDLVVLGGAVTINGKVNGNVLVKGGQVTLNAVVKGSVSAAARAISFGPQTAIGGKLIYASPSEASLTTGMVKSGVEYNKVAANKATGGRGALIAFLAIGLLVKLLSLFVLAFILVAVFKKRVLATVLQTSKNFWQDLLYGFATMILAPVAALLLLITVIGAPIALLVMAAYGILMILAGVFAPILIGSCVWKLLVKNSEYKVNAYTILVGVIVYGLVALLPIVGWAIDLVFMLVALGALVNMVGRGLENAKHGAK